MYCHPYVSSDRSSRILSCLDCCCCSSTAIIYANPFPVIIVPTQKLEFWCRRASHYFLDLLDTDFHVEFFVSLFFSSFSTPKNANPSWTRQHNPKSVFVTASRCIQSNENVKPGGTSGHGPNRCISSSPKHSDANKEAEKLEQLNINWNSCYCCIPKLSISVVVLL